MLKTEQSQNMFFSQTMNLNLSILQMNRVALNIMVENTSNHNPLIKSNNPLSNTKSSLGVIEDIISYEKTLFEELREELLLEIEENDYPILHLIIGNLSSMGFLTQNLEKLCQGITEDIQRAEFIRELIKNSSFLGLASYDSKEYLLFIVKHYYGEDSLEFRLAQLLTQHQHLTSKKIYKMLSSVSKNNIDIALEKIKKLTPSPLNGENSKPVYPDFIVTIKDDKLIVQISPYSAPTINIQDYDQSEYYLKELKIFLKEAKTLQVALERRKDSLQKHAEALILMRSDFFLGTKEAPKAQLKDIAKITNRHISTVSRTLKDRYFLFNNIVYPFSILRNHNIGNSDRHTIKKLIQTIIEQETDALSDTMITEILNKKGITIARRTVNKYRKELAINSLYQR